jgi:hypothetical protein
MAMQLFGMHLLLPTNRKHCKFVGAFAHKGWPVAHDVFFVRFPLKDATVIHTCFLFSMSFEVQLRECRRQQLERWPYCLHLSMAKHGKLWLASGNVWQHLATRVTACHYITEVVPEGYCVVFSGSKQSLGLGLQTSPMNYGTHGTHGS